MPTNLKILIVIMVLALGTTFLVDFSGRDFLKTVPVDLDKQAENLGDELAPDVTFNVLDQPVEKLSDYRDKVVVLNFWASWCPPCVAELPDLIELADSYPNELHMIFLSNDLKREDIDKFTANMEESIQERIDLPNITMAWDKGGKITRETFQTFQLPETIIIDKDGRMVRKIVGVIDWNNSDIRNYLADLGKIEAPKKKRAVDTVKKTDIETE